MKNYIAQLNNYISEYGVFYLFKELFYRLSALKYRLFISSLGKSFVVIGGLNVFNRGKIVIGNKINFYEFSHIHV